MRFAAIASFHAMHDMVASCVIGLHPSAYQTYERDRIVNTKRYVASVSARDNGTHWTVDENIRQMQVSDDAFIARDFALINHHPNSTMYYPGSVTMDLPEHITDMRLFFSTYSNLAPHNHNYKIIFGEGEWTVALAQLTGTNDGPLAALSGAWLPPTERTVKVDLMTYARWNDGLMMEEYLWYDVPGMYRQLGILPTIPPSDAPDLELNPFITPLSTEPGVDNSAANKLKMAETDDALNAGAFDAQSMNLSPNITIYGLNDNGLDLQSYLHALSMLKTTFPDLRLENRRYRQIIGQGDWTATIAMLSGTHQGPLVLPHYLASSPIPPTGRKFNLLHYTICRWQGGKIVDMRINIDTFGILSALGISL